ncbi:MAG: hypothetical protein LQ348_001992 [Seirophora lacunosa]|nr:MAG: hypothetical protein LQ348_001992 [Seirophora lacunosa]
MLTGGNHASGSGFKDKIKMIWNDRSLEYHQESVRDRVISMPLLGVLKIKTHEKTLSEDQNNLRGSDESALSIVPSRFSKSLRDDASILSDGAKNLLEYQRSTQCKNLLTTKVYKKNYRSVFIRDQLQKSKALPSPRLSLSEKAEETPEGTFEPTVAEREQDQVGTKGTGSSYAVNGVLLSRKPDGPVVQRHHGASLQAKRYDLHPPSKESLEHLCKMGDLDSLDYTKSATEGEPSHSRIRSPPDSSTAFHADTYLPSPFLRRTKWKVGEIDTSKIEGPRIRATAVSSLPGVPLGKKVLRYTKLMKHRVYFRRFFTESLDLPQHSLGSLIVTGNPLDLALYHNRLNAVNLLLSTVDVVLPSEKTTTDLLRTAIETSDEQMLAVILKINSDIYLRNMDGEQPLHLACRSRAQQCIEMLVD